MAEHHPPGAAGAGPAFFELVRGAGGTVRELWWTVGEYDIAQVVEFPDEETGRFELKQGRDPEFFLRDGAPR